MSTDPFNNGWTWYADGYAETSANLGGSGNWLTYQQENILTRARRHAGKTNRYGLSLLSSSQRRANWLLHNLGWTCNVSASSS